jgi:hypothetical protein
MRAGSFRLLAIATYILTKVQKSLRLLLRAFWTCGAVYILGWFLNRQFGWFSDPKLWFQAGLAVAGINIIRIFIPHLSLDRFLWRLDRRLELKEQVSTAWEVSRKKDRGILGNLLIKDAILMLSQVIKRISRYGWFLRWDVLASIIVAIVLVVIFLTRFLASPSVPGYESGILPSSSGDPSAQDIYPSGIPGMEPGESDEQAGKGDRDPSDEPVSGALSATAAEELTEMMARLGERLSAQAATSALGEELQQGDFTGTAEQLELLAGQVDQLSGDTLNEFSDALSDAADQIETPENQQLAEDLNIAADALQSPNTGSAGEALDQLAEDFTNIGEYLEDAQSLGEDLAVSENQLSEGVPADRLEGEGEVLIIPAEEASGIVQASGSSDLETSSILVGGTESVTEQTNIEKITGVIDPYFLPWSYRDVVSEYFTP